MHALRLSPKTLGLSWRLSTGVHIADTLLFAPAAAYDHTNVLPGSFCSELCVIVSSCSPPPGAASGYSYECTSLSLYASSQSAASSSRPMGFPLYLIACLHRTRTARDRPLLAMGGRGHTGSRHLGQRLRSPTINLKLRQEVIRVGLWPRPAC